LLDAQNQLFQFLINVFLGVDLAITVSWQAHVLATKQHTCSIASSTCLKYLAINFYYKPFNSLVVTPGPFQLLA
jgi:hypothetical protein